MYIIVIGFLLTPKEILSSTPNDKTNSWIEIIMISGFAFAVVKYTYDKFISDETRVYNYSETDSSSFALTYLLEGDSLKKFLNLTSEEERKEYIKMYWNSFDPYPYDSQNELFDEYTYRVKTSNTLYSTSSRPGWRTDQGRIFILYGKPIEIERRPFVSSFFQSPYNSKYVDLEIWYYNKSGERTDLPDELKSICGNRMFFLFGKLSSAGNLEQLYSSELGELNQIGLFQKTEWEKK